MQLVNKKKKNWLEEGDKRKYTACDQRHGMWVATKGLCCFLLVIIIRRSKLWLVSQKHPRPVNNITNIATTSETCSMLLMDLPFYVRHTTVVGRHDQFIKHFGLLWLI